MTVIGIDDTDSREAGMCTTYVGAELGDRIRDQGGTVTRTLLVRLNPAVEHKTRGNAAVAVHTDLDPDRATALLRESLALAESHDPETNPGGVVGDVGPAAVPDAVADHARRAIHRVIPIPEARALAEAAGWRVVTDGNGRGLVGALAAAGAWRAFEEWTYEAIAYRERSRWGSPRDVDEDSLFEAAESAYPRAWDTVDRATGYPVCVPRTPCPVLYGIRGEDPETVASVARAVGGEPVAGRCVFVTNQGTDAHLVEGSVGAVADGGAYRVEGTVVGGPSTREGGHVHLTIAERGPGSPTTTGTAPAGTDAGPTLECVAFEPTKRFRDHVRALRPGDRITACGEVADGTVKLEKFAVRSLVRSEPVPPICPSCGRSMESAGRDQGYRCRDCGTGSDGPVDRRLDRDIEAGWYEVPPVARRHVAKPLVRGGFDGPTHPAR